MDGMEGVLYTETVFAGGIVLVDRDAVEEAGVDGVFREVPLFEFLAQGKHESQLLLLALVCCGGLLDVEEAVPDACRGGCRSGGAASTEKAGQEEEGS
jgi:hypothetical protein